MSYRIDYQGPKKMRGMEKKTVPLPALAGICFLAFLIGAWVLRPEGAAVLGELLLPGDAAVTAGALEELTGALGAGESLRTAVLSFCRQVMGLGPA